tara:strand:- start:1871 stop:2050 length:180 start_codon:yes stop_codon:yes gene_type:complete
MKLKGSIILNYIVAGIAVYLVSLGWDEPRGHLYEVIIFFIMFIFLSILDFAKFLEERFK